MDNLELMNYKLKLIYESSSDEHIMKILNIHREFEEVESKLENIEPLKVEFHLKNINVIDFIIMSIDNCVDKKAALLYYYGYTYAAYAIVNMACFNSIIGECSSKIQELTGDTNFLTELVQYFALKKIGNIQQFFQYIEDDLFKGKIHRVYRFCCVLLFDEELLFNKYFFKSDIRMGFFILYDILERELRYNMSSKERIKDWQTRFISFCSKNVGRIDSPYYMLYAVSRKALDLSVNFPNEALELLNGLHYPSFSECPNKMKTNDLIYLLATRLIILDNAKSYNTLNDECDKLFCEPILLDDNYLWFEERISWYKNKALKNIDFNKQRIWFSEYIKKFSPDKIGNRFYLSPMLRTDETDRSVYHFTDINAITSIIDNNKLRLTRYDFLNDTEELKFLADMVFEKSKMSSNEKFKNFIQKCKGVLASFFSTIEVVPEEYKEIISLIKSNLSNVYILSASDEGDNLSLWHYYSGGTGASFKLNNKMLEMQIQVNNQAIRNDQARLFMREINYINNSDDIPFVNTLEAYFEDNNELDCNAKLYLFCIYILFEAMFTKNSNMAQEREYRFVVIRPQSADLTMPTKYRVKNGNIIIPYIEVEVNPNILIEHIFIAPLNKNDLAKKGLQEYLSSKGFRDVEKIVELSKIKLRY